MRKEREKAGGKKIKKKTEMGAKKSRVRREA